MAKFSKEQAAAIIERLKEKLNAETDLELAHRLGLKQTTFSTWRTRGSVDTVLIITKCSFLDFNFIFKGESREFPVYVAAAGGAKNTHEPVCEPSQYELLQEAKYLRAQVQILQDTIIKLKKGTG
jgi:hypothetical protein